MDHAAAPMPDEPVTWPYPSWIAHRGAGHKAPENTLSAFRLGAARGFHMFECDVKLSADGVVFLLHDHTLERTTNGRGPGGSRPWADLARLDAGSWHSPAYAGESLPTLEAVARYCLANRLMINLEIKPTPGMATPTGRAVAREAQRVWQEARPSVGTGCTIPPLLTSFEPDALLAARDEAPGFPRGLLLERLYPGWLDTARQLDCMAVICWHALWDSRSVSQVQAAGLKKLAYTVNDEPTAQRLLAMGIDGIITDAVDLFAPESGRLNVPASTTPGSPAPEPVPHR